MPLPSCRNFHYVGSFLIIKIILDTFAIDCIFYIYICVYAWVRVQNVSITASNVVCASSRMQNCIRRQNSSGRVATIPRSDRLQDWLLYGDNVITFLSRSWPMSRYRHGTGGCTRRKYARNAKSFVTRARKERGPRSGFRS